jgi:hypothetical protein
MQRSPYRLPVYGSQEAASVIRLSIDGPEEFVEAIREKA